MPNKKLHKILISHFFKFSLIPILVVEIALLVLYFSINAYISLKNTNLLLNNAQSHTLEVLKNESKFISDKLSEVTRLAKVLQYEHQEIMKNSKNFGLPNGEPSFKVAKNGVFYKANKVGSSLYYSAETKIGEKELAKAKFTEAMDISLKSIVDTNENIVAAYFNTSDNMNRLYPFIDDVAQQYGRHINMADYNFYYLADLKHNPKKEPVWTGAYLDPAGNGWMLSCIVPIYNGDILEGVTGIDITIDSFVKNILNRKLPYNANLFMVDKDGMIIAMSEYIENLLGLKELKEHLYTDAILKTIEKPEEFNILKNSTPFASQFKQLIQEKVSTDSLIIQGNEYLALEQKVHETDWELLILIDKNEIFDSIVHLKELSNKIGYFAIAFLLLFYIIFFYFLLRRINIFSDVITQPIVKLSEETTKIKETDSKINTINTDILEIYQLNTNFSNMMSELNKKTQNLNEAKLLAEESSRAKDDFLANMSHELKTPLNSVNLISSIMLKNKKGNFDEKDIKSLGIINNSGKDLLKLVEDILDVSKLEAGEIEAHYSDFNLYKLLEKTYNNFELQMKNKNLGFSYECSKEIGLIHSDEDKVKQVLKNLLSNAFKFTDHGEIKLTVRLNKEFIEFEVKDTGVGIPEDKIEDVFDRFKQVDSSITRKFGGTGLGLSIIKEITTLLGGDIKVESKVNIGSTFTARIKSNKEEIIQKEVGKNSNSLNSNKKKIVLFNNNPIKFISLSVLLQKSFNLTTTSSFTELLDILKESTFDYILLDSSKFDEEKLSKLEIFKEKTILINEEDLSNTNKIKEIISFLDS
ncbi:sensor histidine kinase [Poseidonibacter ostreae]|jgi:signal transduction histidine kinase|uniref:histidine kinase n=2 Tax=Poseidonibacter ostreae TaxID=2654171 RepID=A0A6L4WR57_9BACT|nr:ATP-binding protein [Poseidonibacter ostreae]KAB7886873.1 hypothetical protein GBG19_11585 [Poseidonibacter ostreae]KAB7889922.1 hypothetical protein GBG18_10035 [Poseidonibacter ostreae]